LAAGRKPIEESLKKAGIDPKVTVYQQVPHFEALRNPAKRLEHQLAQSVWRLDYLGHTPASRSHCSTTAAPASASRPTSASTTTRR
jgi:hypothetical protein